MSKRHIKNELEKQFGFEALEERRVFSAQSLVDIVVETQDLPDAIQSEILAHVEATSISEATQTETGESYIEQQYGFDGAGQTVAIIDSGIAFDHAALGGGFGENARVVGGFDFAENDSNPFDDGSAGFHGTHVAGIVGSTDAVNRGVSPGVDLVGLRVFDDNGAGGLEQVEKALRYVIDNQDSFANPITTVNLSLGTNINTDTPPDFSILEDEFQQLEMDGIFISVAAGNAFQQFGTEGLSYPASSPFVVPVASHGADGTLSDFSQRADGVLVAPGENIRSTVPDHIFGGTRPDSFLAASGTSQAAPFVAGASAVVRQALEFSGADNIDQDTIYNIFRETADPIFDSVTGSTFHRINLQAAIESIVTDAHGDTAASATNIDARQLLDGQAIQGTIGKVSDVDSFKFTARESGRVTFEIETTDDLIANLDFPGTSVDVDGNLVSFEVTQGEQYEFSLSTSEGIGHYQISASIQAAATNANNGSNASNAPNASNSSSANANDANSARNIQWGGVDQEILTDVTVNGESTYEFNANREGLLTVVAETQTGVRLSLYDAQMNEISATSDANGQLRFDVSASKGERFFLRATGSGQFDASLTNLVSLKDGELSVHGTEASDTIQIDTRGRFEVQVNSVDYQFTQNSVQQVSIDGQGGSDQLRINLGGTNDVVTLGPGSAIVSNALFRLDAESIESNTVHAGGGSNRLILNDSVGNDRFVSDGDSVALLMQAMTSRGQGFQFVEVVSTAGNDTASIAGTEGDDRFAFRNGTASLQSSNGQVVLASGFEEVVVDAGGGNDIANLFDSSGNDLFELGPNDGFAETAHGQVTVGDFERINAVANAGGDDSIVLQDSTGNDRYFQRNNVSIVRGGGFTNRATGFDTTTVISVGGQDSARIFGSEGDDILDANGAHTTLTTGTDVYEVQGFERVNVIAVAGGNDVAVLNGTTGNDRAFLNPNSASLNTSEGVNRATGFDRYTIRGNGGNDSANLIGSDGDDHLTANQNTTRLETPESDFRLTSFENQRFDGRGGSDTVSLSRFDEDDLLVGDGLNLRSAIDGTTLSATNFSFLNAATDLVSRYDLSSVDYLFMLDGDWQEAE